MDLSKDFIQYQLDNPHNYNFKCLIGKEDREDTLDGFRKILDILKLQPDIKVGDTVYVLTYEKPYREVVIECKVTRLSYISKFSFSVKGRFNNGDSYNANFGQKSIGKKVFFSRSEAEKRIKF